MMIWLNAWPIWILVLASFELGRCYEGLSICGCKYLLHGNGQVYEPAEGLGQHRERYPRCR